ncbi:MAG TPA: hypothetical protein VJ851_00780 [Jatrophihabitans sp.]|nr:hypothetical protein [Jatrophihabitans sp.]
MTRITVGTQDFRRALRAVTPHADPDPDFPQLHRVRLVVGGENLTVSATNRHTLGHAIVSILDNHTGVVGDELDLSPNDVREILALFKPNTKAPDESLLIEVDDRHTTVTDVSGLFPGKSLRLPRYPMEEHFPSVALLIREVLTRTVKSTERLIANGKLYGLFVKASDAYGQWLVIEPAGSSSAILYTCGESFVGMLMPVRGDDDTYERINGWHADWLERLTDLAPVVADA